MRRGILASIIVLLCSMTKVASAGAFFGVNAGVALPTGDFADLVKTGFQGGGRIGMHVTENIAVGVDVAYLRFGEKTFEFRYGSSVAFAKYRMQAMQATAFSKVRLSDASGAPFVKLGGGLYRLSDREIDGTNGVAQIDYGSTTAAAGVNVGAGFDWRLGYNALLGIEGVYHVIFTDFESTKAMTFALNYAFSMN